MKDPELKVVRAHVPPDFKNRIAEQAKKESKFESDIVRKALSMYLDTKGKKSA